MLGLKLVIVSCFCWVSTGSKHLPSYIKACKRGNPNENECALKNSIAAIPSLIKGDPVYKIPVLDPLSLPRSESGSGQNLKVTFLNATLYGLGGMDIKSHNIDPVAQRVDMDFTFKKLRLVGEYSISGQVLIMPITGNGPFDITFEDCYLDYYFKYELLKKSDNKDYANVTESDVNIEIKRGHFYFENLFNGNKEMGEHMNKFLNENFKEVVLDVGVPLMKRLVNLLSRQVLDAIFSVVPYDELLPM